MAARPPDFYCTNHSYAAILLLLLLSAVPARSQNLQTQIHSFGSFNKSHQEEGTLKVLKDSSINSGALQLTPDTGNNASFYLSNKSGRVLLSQSFRLWDSGNTSFVASFNTSFLVNIYRLVNDSAVPAEGLAFVIAPDLQPPAAGSEGGYLGLTTNATDGNSSNKLVAVELDTFRQKDLGDPDSNHVGLNINSVRSNVTASLNGSDIELSPLDGTSRNVWIEYDGRSKRIAVYVALENAPKPPSPVLSAALDISRYVAQDSYFGFAGSTGTYFELNCIKQWNLSVEIIPVDKKSSKKALVLGLAIGVPVVVVVIAVVAIAAWYIRRREDRKILKDLSGVSMKWMPREFTYKELRKATGNFSESNKLGQGGFGAVYRGNLHGDVGEVAVKMFLKGSKMDDFVAELTIINRLRHRHLVRLLGWCYRKGKLLLVYEYMPGGSLDWHLYKAPPESILQWNRRYTILVGVASALNYLHNEYEQKVVHRDLKASNILLDLQYKARLGDFGLARAIEPERTSYAEEGLHGTVGYIAPEIFHAGKATRESDVYGFGSVVLEVVCGRLPSSTIDGHRFLVNWVWMLHREGRLLEAVDEKLQGVFEAAEAERLLMLGLACCHPMARERPKTEDIVQIMNGSLPLPVVPLSRPDFVFPGTVQIEVEDDGRSSMPGFSSGNPSSYASTMGASTLYGGWTTGSEPSGDYKVAT